MFQLNEQEREELSQLGSETFAKLKKWELEHALKETPSSPEYDYAFRMPAADQEMIAIQQHFQESIRAVLGEANLSPSLARSRWQSSIVQSQDYVVSFSLKQDEKGRQLAKVDLANIDSSGKKTGGSSIGLGPVGDEWSR